MSENKLNVCLMNDSFPPAIDGVANATINYANNISKLGAVTVVTPEYPNVTDDYPFDVLRYKSLNIEKICGYRAGYPFSSRMLQNLSERNFDIIHSHCPWASTLMARVLREKTNVPIVLTYHTKFDVEINRALHGKALQAQAERFILGNIAACDKVWTVSNGARDNLLEIASRHSSYEIDGSKIDVVENGVDFPQGEAREEYVEALLSAYQIGRECPLFLFVGRLMWYKGIRLILDALRIIKERGRDFRMIFVGDGADRQEMETYTAEIGLADRCIFAGAIRDREELRVYYTAADLFLFPSEYDTNGIVVREAAACGVGSLLIEGSCAAEGIEDGRTGVLVRPDAAEIAEKLDVLCANRTKMREIGQHAMDEVYLSWETAVKRAYDLYPTIIEQKRAGSTERHESFVQEEFFSLIDSATDSIQRLRSIPSEIRGDFRETRDQFRNAWQKLTENIRK
ncbi:MAG: glycosyltransferase [Oscillospiraceae bacterium]